MSEAEEQPPPMTPLVPALAMAGTALLVAGTFCPVVVLGPGEARSYRQFSWADGNIVLATAAIAFVLTWVFGWYRGLFVAGGLALFLIGATLLKVPRAGLVGAALSWGWLPLVAGAVLLLAAAAVAERRRPPEQPPPEEDDDFEA